MTVREQLGHIGLTQGEIDVYLALSELGSSTTGRITKKAGISSSKVYEVLQRLISKGLAGYVIENNKRHYNATPAKRLLDYLEEKKDALTKTQKEIEKLAPQLQKQEQRETEAIIYRGDASVKMVLKELAEAGSKGKEIVGYSSDEDDFEKQFPAQVKAFREEAIKKRFKIRTLAVKGARVDKHVTRYRILPAGYLPPIRTIIAGDKLFIIDFNRPMTTIVIQKKTVVDYYQKHFEALWKISK